MFSRPDAGVLLALYRRHERAAHHGELQQMFGAAVNVGAEVEHCGVAVALHAACTVAMAGRSMPSSVLSR